MIRIANNARYIGPVLICCFVMLSFFSIVPSNLVEKQNLFGLLISAFMVLTAFGWQIIKFASMRSVDLTGRQIRTSTLFGITSEIIQLKDIQTIQADKSFFTFSEEFLDRPRTYILTYLKDSKYKSFKFYVDGKHESSYNLNYFISEVEKVG